MGDIIKIVKDVLAKDPEYLTVGPRVFNYEMFRYFQLFAFGEHTEQALMELTFGCQKCGDCCHKVTRKDGLARSDGYCPSLLSDKRCDKYRSEDYPLQCEIYPFMLPTLSNTSKGLGFEQSNLMQTHFVYDFGILDDLALVIADYDKGWMKGDKKIGQLFSEVKDAVLKFDDRRTVPKMGEDDADYEIMFLEDVKNLKKTLTGAGSRI
jgi:hypothetical protein